MQQVTSLFPQSSVKPDPDALLSEMEILSDYCESAKSIADVAKIPEELKMLKLANRVCRLTLTAPVSVASNERTFSKMKLIKNYLRTTIHG